MSKYPQKGYRKHMTTALPCAHQHKKLVNALWCGDCGAYNELDGNNWQLPSGRVEDNPPSGKTLSVEELEEAISNYLKGCGIMPSLMQPWKPIVLAQAIFNAQKGTE